MLAPIEPLLTVADLDCLPDDGNRYELIEGELFVSSAAGLPHQRVLGRLYASLNNYLDQQPHGEVIITPGVIFSDDSAVIPDLVYVSHSRAQMITANHRFVAAPELLIEIVSPGSQNIERDRVIKRQLYGKFGVEEYWVVDPQSHTVEVYRLQQRSLRLVQRLGVMDELSSPLLPGYSCQLGTIFAAP